MTSQRTARFLHVLLFLILPAAILAPAPSQAQEKDPAFARIPFDQWVAQGNHADFPWKVNTHSPELTGDQRLMVEASITVDGNSSANRVSGGEVLMLIQIEDGQGHIYQAHGTEKASLEKIIYPYRVLVTPGDYRFTVAVVDSATGRHNLESSPLHVAPLQHDPLSNSWAGLPSVEFVSNDNSPKNYFHPEVTGCLHLPVANRMPVRIELVVVLPVRLDTVIPQLKALSEIELQNGVVNVTLLNVGLRQTIPVARHGRLLSGDSLDSALNSAFDEIYGGGVGVQASSEGPLDFLTQQIGLRLADNSDGVQSGSDARPILIV